MRDDAMQRLTALGLKLPTPPQPMGAYKPEIESGAMLYVSMQGPVILGQPKRVGLLGRDLKVEEGRTTARLAALNASAQIHQHFLGGIGSDRLFAWTGMWLVLMSSLTILLFLMVLPIFWQTYSKSALGMCGLCVALGVYLGLCLWRCL